MIARVWRGATPIEQAEAYLAYLQQTGVKDCLATDGNRGVYVLRRSANQRSDFLFISLWRSLEDIRRFAGPNLQVAVYYPEDPQFLLELEPTVDHYEVFGFDLS